MLTSLYEMWQWVLAISAAIGVISVLIVFWKYVNKNSTKNNVLRFLGNILVITSGVAICMSCMVGLMFTKVPLVYGGTVKEAYYRLEDANLNIGFQPGVNRDNSWSNEVIGQSINEDSLVQKGTTVIVYVNMEQTEIPDVEGMIFVPNVVGMEQVEATELLTERGLQFQVWWTGENNIEAEQYYIINQSIPADSQVPAGTLVKLELSPYQP